MEPGHGTKIRYQIRLPQKKEPMTSHFSILTKPAVSTPTRTKEITTIIVSL